MKRGKIKMYEFTTMGWLRHVIFHPIEGFEDLRWKKQGSLKVAFGIVVLLFIAMVARRQLTGFAFNGSYTKIFNVVPLLVNSVVYFFTWVIANWSVCTLLDGEGRLKQICINSAYSLVPFIVGTFLATLISNFMVLDEAIWVNAVYYLGVGWSVILMFQAMKAVHQYTVPKTIFSILLTLIVMLLILFLAILLLSLFQQVYVFIYSIYTEISYRIRG